MTRNRCPADFRPFRPIFVLYSCKKPTRVKCLCTQTLRTTPARAATILARILGNENGQLPSNVARYILTVGFSDDDKARMHELAVRNQEDELSAGEREELFEYAKAGTVLSILKSTARRTLRAKAKSGGRSGS
jgi:hypothetical protein